MKRLLLAGWLLLTTVLAGAEVPAGRFGSLATGDAAPDFTAMGSDGKEIKLSSFKGRTIVLSFWAPNRGPADALETVVQNYSGMNVVVIGVCSIATRAEFDAWVAKTKGSLSYLLAWDPAGKNQGESIAQKNFGIGVFPSSGVIDSAGKIVGGFVGFGAQSGLVLRDYLRAAGVGIPPEEKPAVPEGSASDPVPLKPGTVAPDFTTLDAAGKPVKLSDYAGKVVVLDFWATWCGPCIASMPHTHRVAAMVKNRGVVVLASCTSDTREDFERWWKENGAKYPNVVFSHDPAGRSPEAISLRLYGVAGIPAQFVIGRDGKIAEMIDGYGEGDSRLEDALTKLGVTFPPAALRR